jgi:hypothetical protein
MKRAQSLGILAVLFVVRLSMSFQFGSGPTSMRLRRFGDLRCRNQQQSLFK